REMDLILGRFADAEIATLSDGEIEQYERLLDVPDVDLFTFVTGERPTPPELATPLFQRIVALSRRQGLIFST
ncbi:MAG TPA: succinate dehydrogenase assembly factor 2, partial [Tianweitania sediminis]|nr:succinate dehydrogenase assembly factor 2 [Tianweitania sediminis]